MSARGALLGTVGGFAEEVMKTGLGPSHRHAVAGLVLDAVGNIVLGTRQPVAGIAHRVARLWGGSGSATVVGRPIGLPPTGAAFVNGTLAHCTDFDDTHLPSLLHPGAAVIPAVLAVAEVTGADGPESLDAMLLGIELCIRLGMAGFDEERRNSIYFDRGQHATSLCGAIASAVAVSALLSGDAATITSAGAIAASMSSGLIEANRTGGSVKQIHTGWAAHCGVAAAQLAAAGLTGPHTVLEGRFGFFTAFCGERSVPQVVTDDLGELWHADQVQIKRYPCNYFTHAGVDCALELRARGVRPADVAGIELGVPEPALRTIAEPRAAKITPVGGYAAAFSGPYTFAAALTGGGGLGVHLADFTDEAARRAEVVDLAARIGCSADAECTEVFPRRIGTRARVTLRDGRVEEVLRFNDRPGLTYGVTGAELNTKFALNCEVFGAERSALVSAEIRALVSATSARSVMSLLRTEGKERECGGSD